MFRSRAWRHVGDSLRISKALMNVREESVHINRRTFNTYGRRIMAISQPGESDSRIVSSVMPTDDGSPEMQQNYFNGSLTMRHQLVSRPTQFGIASTID